MDYLTKLISNITTHRNKSMFHTLRIDAVKDQTLVSVIDEKEKIVLSGDPATSLSTQLNDLKKELDLLDNQS